ncbi:MAG: polysaccharide biosynthesis protein [Gordonia sp. (in: high G+C Gram-positive bacteria)]
MIATVVSAASGYLVLLLAARHLGAAGYAVFAVFWAAYGLVSGAQNGQLQETTRAVRAAADTSAHGARPLGINVGIGAAMAGVITITAPLWSSAVFDAHRGVSVLLLAVGVASFSVYAQLSGALSGSARWTPFALLLGIDAVTRLVATVLAVTLDMGVAAFLVMTVIGSVSWCLLLAFSASARTAIGLRGDVPAPRLGVNTLTAMAAALASAVVVMGFPVLINATARAGDDHRTLGAIILAVTLTRAPLLVPLNSFQGFLISRFVSASVASSNSVANRPVASPAVSIQRTVIRSLAIPLTVVAAVGTCGALAAWAIGGWLVTHVFGSDYALPGASLAWFTVGATALGALTVTGAATIALGAHRWYAAGWWLTALSCALLLTVPIAAPDRVSLSLVAGPLVGAGIHLIGLLRATRRINT